MEFFRFFQDENLLRVQLRSIAGTKRDSLVAVKFKMKYKFAAM